MALASKAAKFSPGKADMLRRAMASWKRKGDQIYRFGQELIEGMTANGLPEEFARRCFEQIKGFSEYGFPESHAASFALLVALLPAASAPTTQAAVSVAMPFAGGTAVKIIQGYSGGTRWSRRNAVMSGRAMRPRERE